MFNFKVIVYGVIGALVVGGIACIYTGELIGNTALVGDGWAMIILGIVSFFLRIIIKIFTGI